MKKTWIVLSLLCWIWLWPLFVGAQQVISEAEQQRLEQLTTWIEAEPTDVDSIWERSTIYYKYKQYSLAIKDLTHIINLYQFPETYNNRGLCYQHLRQYSLALKDFNRALSKKPEDVGFLINRGFTYHRMGKYEQALRDFSLAIHLKPDEARAYYQRALTYYALDLYQAAKVDLAQACGLGEQEACGDLDPQKWEEN